MTIWRMHIACCIPKVTNTHSEYVIHFCFSTATMVTWTGLTVTLHYTGRLVTYQTFHHHHHHQLTSRRICGQLCHVRLSVKAEEALSWRLIRQVLVPVLPRTCSISIDSLTVPRNHICFCTYQISYDQSPTVSSFITDGIPVPLSKNFVTRFFRFLIYTVMCRGLAEGLHYHTYTDSTRQYFRSYVTRLVKNFTAFYGTDRLLQCRSRSTTGTRYTKIHSAHRNPVSWISTIISSSLPPGIRGSSVDIPTRYDWTVRGSISDGGEIFCTRTDLPWGPLSLLQNVYRVFFGVKVVEARRWPPTPSSADVK